MMTEQTQTTTGETSAATEPLDVGAEELLDTAGSREATGSTVSSPPLHGSADDHREPLTHRLRLNRIPTKLWRGAISFSVFFLAWALAAAYVDRSIILVGPIDSIQALIDVARTGELWRHAQVSFREFAIGFMVGSAIGIPLGLLTGTMPKVKEFLDPILNGLYATPLIALAPLFIIWFGIGETKTIVLVIILVFLPVAVNTDVGIRSTDPVLLEAARSFGANRRQRFTKVQLPWSLSFIVTGLRLGVGRGLIGVVVGELFGSRAGLGFMILQASQVFNTALVLGGVLLFAVIGVTMVLIMEWIERRVAPWRHR